MSRNEIVLGIDVATSSLRVVALDTTKGALLAAVETKLSPVTGDAGIRVQRADYGPVAVAAIAAVAALLGKDASRVRAISTTGTSGTIVPVDRSGNPLAEAVMYNDLRGQAELHRLEKALHPGRVYSSLARLAWMQRHSAAPLFLHTPDIVNAHLARAVLPTDTSHTLKAGVDARHRAWPAAEMAQLGVDASRLPSLVWPGSPIGEISSALAAEMGLPPRIAIVSGMSDGCTSQMATGGIGAGDAVGVIGTTFVLKAVVPRELGDRDRGIYSHLAPDGSYWAGGASNAGAAVLETRAAQLGDLAELDEMSWRHGPASAVCYPLPRAGERFPLNAPAMRSFIVPVDGGYTLNPAPLDLFRSVQEGVAFIERLALEALVAMGFAPAGRHLMAGGGSASRTWNAIRATVLARPVDVPIHRTSAFGAAVLAAIGALPMPLAEAARRFCGSSETVDPVKAWSAALEDRYAIFRQTVGALEPGAPVPPPLLHSPVGLEPPAGRSSE
jgi:xylulokinase